MRINSTLVLYPAQARRTLTIRAALNMGINTIFGSFMFQAITVKFQSLRSMNDYWF